MTTKVAFCWLATAKNVAVSWTIAWSIVMAKGNWNYACILLVLKNFRLFNVKLKRLQELIYIMKKFRIFFSRKGRQKRTPVSFIVYKSENKKRSTLAQKQCLWFIIYAWTTAVSWSITVCRLNKTKASVYLFNRTQ